jgi:hypothetical protein
MYLPVLSLTADCDGQSNDGCRPALLFAAGITVRLCRSSFVFAQHEAAHEHCTEHDDEAEKV